ncbi:MAG: hypothetical protein M1481_04355 [Candidatus Thermoplasmatota archaeon]|jgi:hypothetical protein|nr:hypothetical protein [Candidatus Thermoplasmatota archaeon]
MDEIKSVIKESIWANRFIYVAIIIGAVAFFSMATFLMQSMFYKPSAAMVVASGSAGTWLTVGFVGLMLVGVLGTAVSGLFYWYLEVILNKSVKGISAFFAWIHIIFMSIGTIGASILMMYGGFFGGAAMLPKYDGGLGETALWVHVNILSSLMIPIGIFMAIGAFGVFAGGIAYITSMIKNGKKD